MTDTECFYPAALMFGGRHKTTTAEGKGKNMNADRRKRIAKLVTALEALQGEAEALFDEETEAFENMPEGLQQSERGEASEAACSELEAALNFINDAIESYGNID